MAPHVNLPQGLTVVIYSMGGGRVKQRRLEQLSDEWLCVLSVYCFICSIQYNEHD